MSGTLIALVCLSLAVIGLALSVGVQMNLLVQHRKKINELVSRVNDHDADLLTIDNLTLTGETPQGMQLSGSLGTFTAVDNIIYRHAAGLD